MMMMMMMVINNVSLAFSFLFFLEYNILNLTLPLTPDP